MYIGKTKHNILKLIDKKPIHGYQISKELDISLTTTYEHLDFLEKKNFIKKSNHNNVNNVKKICFITDRGKKFIQLIDEIEKLL